MRHVSEEAPKLDLKNEEEWEEEKIKFENRNKMNDSMSKIKQTK